MEQASKASIWASVISPGSTIVRLAGADVGMDVVADVLAGAEAGVDVAVVVAAGLPAASLGPFAARRAAIAIMLPANHRRPPRLFEW